MSPNFQAAARAAGPVIKKVAAVAMPVAAPMVADVVKPLVPDKDQITEASAFLTPSGRLGRKIEKTLEHTSDMTIREDASPAEQELYREWHGRARKLNDRLKNAKAGGVTKEQLAAIEADRVALQADIDAALR